MERREPLLNSKFFENVHVCSHTQNSKTLKNTECMCVTVCVLIIYLIIIY